MIPVKETLSYTGPSWLGVKYTVLCTCVNIVKNVKDKIGKTS